MSPIELTVTLAAGALVAFGAARGSAAQEWKPARGPLTTPWTASVNPQTIYREYPRPTLVRKAWQSLNGLWDYAVTPAAAGQPNAWQGRILVPFPIESALSGVMRSVKPAEALWYRHAFTVPAAWRQKRLLLHLGAVDWSARVLVNGREAGAHKGGYDGFTVDVTDYLTPSGKQELVVQVTDPTDQGGQPRGKQVLRPEGIWYTPTTGIWQSVWLEPVPREGHITGLKVTPDVDRGVVTVQSEAAGSGLTLRAEALAGARVVARGAAPAGSPIELGIQKPRLWSPSSPYLYNLRLTLLQGDRVVDTARGYFGMRKIALGKDEKGITRIVLNGEPLFQIGPLDQGFWPDGLYTAPGDEALRFDVEVTRRLGFNMARKHVKVEPERWYYWCDKLGLLVWQDMPSGNNASAEDKAQYERELAALVRGRYNHPSIVMWVVFNEGWGQYDTERVTEWTRGLDPSRLVNNASGWTDRKVGDVIDMHNYPGPGSPKPEPTRAAVLGEFGGLGLAVPEHTWTSDWWGYQGVPSKAALTRRYVELLRRTWALKDDPGLSAAVYTQTTDVEVECNGLLTYDRKVYKVDIDQVAAANRGQLPPPPTVTRLTPTADKQAVEWRYTTTDPGEGWEKPDFDDSAWEVGLSGFGARGTVGSFVGTEWTGRRIWLRRRFTLNAVPRDPMLWMHHDEDVRVYLNGVQATQAGGFTIEYQLFDVARDAISALKAGQNVMAVSCRQTTGGQFIDAGLVTVAWPRVPRATRR